MQRPSCVSRCCNPDRKRTATKYDYVAVREVIVDTGDGVPLVEVDLRPGRESERKKALVNAIAEILHDSMGVKAPDICVLFRRASGVNGSARLSVSHR